MVMKHYWQVLVDALQHGYEAHMEKVQMRLAPVKPPRSWHDIPHAGPGWR
jgi:hypothetical protein